MTGQEKMQAFGEEVRSDPGLVTQMIFRQRRFIQPDIDRLRLRLH